MAGNGPAPEAERRRTNAPARGDWKAAAGVGWQHGPIPQPEVPLLPATLEVWDTWMQSWVASYWSPVDLPGLNIAIGLYDMCRSYFDEPFVEKETRKGDSIYVLKPNPTAELRQYMDNYGISPKGQQDRRWAENKGEQPVGVPSETPTAYEHLRVVGGRK